MGFVALAIGFAMFVLTYVATATIITKAGYSVWWILLPLSVPVAFLAAYSLFSFTVFSGNISFSTLAHEELAMVVIIWLLSFVNWVFFLVFAFSDWPALQQQRRYRATPLPNFGPSPTVAPVGAPAAPFSQASPAVVVPAAAAPVMAPAAAPPSSEFCTWCGAERAVDAFALHHCGPKSRPKLYCTTCGSGLNSDGSCPACAGAAARAVVPAPLADGAPA